MMGIDNKNFVINSGSYFIFFVQIIVFGLLKEILNEIATQFPYKIGCRRLGLQVYSKHWRKDIV